jgi:hypothetical protein
MPDTDSNTEKTYDVLVCRTAYRFATIRVTATSPEMADREACQLAGDHEFGAESSSIYEAQGTTEVQA